MTENRFYEGMTLPQAIAHLLRKLRELEGRIEVIEMHLKKVMEDAHRGQP